MVTSRQCQMHDLVEGGRVLKSQPASPDRYFGAKTFRGGMETEEVWMEWSPDSKSSFTGLVRGQAKSHHGGLMTNPLL